VTPAPFMFNNSIFMVQTATNNYSKFSLLCFSFLNAAPKLSTISIYTILQLSALLPTSRCD